MCSTPILLLISAQPARLPQMPAYHLVRDDRAGITMVNIGVGPGNAKAGRTVERVTTAMVSVLRYDWLWPNCDVQAPVQTP